MTYTANDPLANIIWNALETTQRPLGLVSPLARKYHRDIAPFGALAENSPQAVAELRSLMEAGEALYVIAEEPLAVVDGLKVEGSGGVAQMVFPQSAFLPEAGDETGIVPLACSDSAEMLELIAIAFPGFFRERTCVMGPYAGIRAEGRLVAMTGDRMALGDLREVSGVCTHPEFTGQGLATKLILNKLREHRRLGFRSFLHTGADNARAIRIYQRLGFIHTRVFTMQRVRRVG